MADLGIIFLRRKHTIHWYQSLFTIMTGSMSFRSFWATLYSMREHLKPSSFKGPSSPPYGSSRFVLVICTVCTLLFFVSPLFENPRSALIITSYRKCYTVFKYFFWVHILKNLQQNVYFYYECPHKCHLKNKIYQVWVYVITEFNR